MMNSRSRKRKKRKGMGMEVWMCLYVYKECVCYRDRSRWSPGLCCECCEVLCVVYLLCRIVFVVWFCLIA